MSDSCKLVPINRIRDYSILMTDGSEIPLKDLVDGYIDIVNSIGEASCIHQITGSPMVDCELQYSMMSRLCSAT